MNLATSSEIFKPIALQNNLDIQLGHLDIFEIT
jgi:hypothetical protein